MAKVRWFCEWCKKLRFCEMTEVLMRESPGYGVEFARRWMLCSECRESCNARLHVAFRDRPE